MHHDHDQSSTTPLTYAAAGVDIAAAGNLVECFKRLAAPTRRAEVLGGVGGFGALIRLGGYHDPVLVAGTDGVGTKLLLALQWGELAGLGIDLVAMNANDVLCHGAAALFFLDYLAMGRLEADKATTLVQGMAEACAAIGCALVGGETAELPGMYPDGLFDLAGFCVGVVERDRLLDGSRVTAGDLVLGLASNGVHANGFTLVRAIMARCGAQATTMVGGMPLKEILLAPTRLYQPAVWPLLQNDLVHAMAHITGGGLVDNLPRVVPAGLEIHLQRDSWPLPDIFGWLKQQGNLDEATMLQTFNLGIGLCLIIPPHALAQSQQLLQEAHVASWVIGSVAESPSTQDHGPRVVLH